MARGQGSMVERPDGSGKWRLRVYAGRDPVSGSPIQVHRTFQGSRTAARKELAALVTEVEADTVTVTAERITVGQLLDRWLEHRKGLGKVRPRTAHEYQRKIDQVIRPALGAVRLRELDPKAIDAWYGRWLEGGASPSTVRIYHSILSAACRQAVKWGLIAQAPTERATPPSAKSPTMKVPTPEQLSALVAAAEDDDPVLAAAIGLAALTGARRGELAALRWSDVDLEAGIMSIERAVTVVAGETIEGATKTHQARRVALDDVGVELLRRHRRFVEHRSELVESPLVADPFILSYQAHCGRPVNPDTISHRFAALCGRLGMPYHFHELRHFSVTTLLAAGVDVRTVSERHGHATATMTLNRYAHALPERDRAAAGVLGRSLMPAAST